VIEAPRVAGDVQRAPDLRQRLHRSLSCGHRCFCARGRVPEMLVAALGGRAVVEADPEHLLVALRKHGEDPVRLAVGADHGGAGLDFAHGNVTGWGEHRRIERLRLPHRRSRREDDEISGLETAGETVEIGESRRDPRDLLLPLVERLDVLERRGDDRLHVHEADGVALLGHGEDAALGFVGEFRHVPVLLVSELGDGAGGLDQPAGQRLLVDDLRVPGEVGGGGNDLVEQIDELVAPDRLEDAHGRQLVLDGDAVDGLTVAEQRAHRLEDLAVGVAVELLCADDLHHVGERLAVEQDAAEEALLRVEVVRWDAAVGQGDYGGGCAHGSILRRRV